MKNLLEKIKYFIYTLLKWEIKEDRIREIFYSPAEKMVFEIRGYYLDNIMEVFKHAQVLKMYARALAQITKTKPSTVKSYHIEHSRRYKYMRVFYVKSEVIPDGAFNLTEENGWTMHKWIHN